MKTVEKLAEEFAEQETGLHPGIGHPGEPYWHRTFQASKKGFMIGFERSNDLAWKKCAGPDEGYLHGCDCRSRAKSLVKK